MDSPAKKIKTVDEYIESQPIEIRSQLRSLRTIIRKAIPTAEELISYQMPAYRSNGMLAFFAGYKHHIGLYGMPKTVLLYKDKLTAYKLSKATIQFPLGKPFPKNLITEMLQHQEHANLLKINAKAKSKIIRIKENISLITITAASFPNGVLKAHQELQNLITTKKNRSYYGISQPDATGKIIYKAAAEEQLKNECKKLGCELFTIQKGKYITLLIKEYKKNVLWIGETFAKLLTHPTINPNGYCVEQYISDSDVLCMVPLKN